MVVVCRSAEGGLQSDPRRRRSWLHQDVHVQDRGQLCGRRWRWRRL